MKLEIVTQSNLMKPQLLLLWGHFIQICVYRCPFFGLASGMMDEYVTDNVSSILKQGDWVSNIFFFFPQSFLTGIKGFCDGFVS